MAHEFQRGDVVLRLSQQVHGQKPERQRQFRRLEDRTGDDSRLVSARLALPVLPAFADEGAVMGFPAMRTYRTSRPARRYPCRVAQFHRPVMLQKPSHR